MRLSARPSFYIVSFLLLSLFGVVFYIYHLLTSPELRQAVQEKKKAAPASVPSPVPVPPSAALMPVDPVNATRAAQLNLPETTPRQDLEIVAEFVDLYRKIHGGNPIGSNEDITAAITGADNPGKSGRLFPGAHSAIRDGQLRDRWGTPYWFHPNSGSQMEIRSAGADRQMFTVDDVVLNPSPSGLGATPQSQPAE